MLNALNEITRVIIACAIDVHHELGPGLLEHVYEACLVFELIGRGLTIERQKPLPVVYKGSGWTAVTGSIYLWKNWSLSKSRRLKGSNVCIPRKFCRTCGCPDARSHCFSTSM
jgi:hypothetical protein